MSLNQRFFNADGSNKVMDVRGEGIGGKQEYSIFGWADSKEFQSTGRSVATDTLEPIRESAVTKMKPAGVKTKAKELTPSCTLTRPGSARRQDDIIGHNIFADGDRKPAKQLSPQKQMMITGSFKVNEKELPSFKKLPSSRAFHSHLQSSVFRSAEDTLPSRPVSALKMSHLKGSMTWWDPSAPEAQRRPLTAQKQKPGGNSTLDLSWNSAAKMVEGPRSLQVRTRISPGHVSQISLG